MKYFDRNNDIYFKRVNGETFNKISQHYNLSVNRVRQIYLIQERINIRKLKYCNAKKFINELNLSIRALNYARNLNIQTIDELVIAIKENHKIKNFGNKSRNEVIKCLNNLGYNL